MNAVSDAGMVGAWDWGGGGGGGGSGGGIWSSCLESTDLV